MRRLVVLSMLVLSACSTEPGPTVLIYAPAESAGTLRSVLANSGFAFEIIEGDSAELTNKVIAKQDSPRADVLVTSSVVDIWRAGDQGALRPLDAATLEFKPDMLNDPDGSWSAISRSSLFIGSMPGAPETSIESYADLGEPEFAGQLCLTSSELPHNRVLLAMLIEDLGGKPAERVVRRWARNLAQPPFTSVDELADALQAGRCKVAILPAWADVDGLSRNLPNPGYFDIEGIGITRHAEQPEEAHKLVAWLLEALHVDAPNNWNNQDIAVAGWRDEEARLLAERAGYR